MPPDYSGQNLRGRSFKGENLTGANFSKADIRGADFTNSILIGADFTGAKAGLQRRWTIGLLIVSWLLAALSGLFPLFIADLLVSSLKQTGTLNYFPEYQNFINFALLVELAIFFIFTVYKGFAVGLKVGAVALTVIVVVIVVGAVAGGVCATVAGDIPAARGVRVAVVVIIALISAVLAALNVAVVFAAAVALTITVAGPIAFAFAVAFAVAGPIAFAVAVAFALAVPIVLAVLAAFTRYVVNNPDVARDLINRAGADAVAFLNIAPVAFAFGFAVAMLGVYVGWHGLAGDEKYALVRSVAIDFAATGGTSFRGADLTDADFTGATLKNTDFKKANLTRTRFYEAKKLDFARVGKTILTNLAVLKLLITGNGRGKSYVGANLKGANLIGADLKEANLKDADINEATFQGACLEWANLTLTQAVRTNFTSAHMTGACVEAWNIESTTKLDNVDCRFIYLLERPKPRSDDRERRPSSGEFQSGEFTKLFEEVLNTVDLIFRNGIDWKAFDAAFKKVQAENEDTELAIKGIENKGDGVVVVKVEVPIDADKEKFHSILMQYYQQGLKAGEEKYKALLKAKDEQIVIYRQQSGEMKEIISLLASKPINVQVDNKLENKNMTNSNDSSRKIEIGSVGGDFNASGQALNLGEISGTVTNTINELPSAEPEKPGIKELLTQLQAAIEAEKDLPEEDKAEALEQVKTLAEAGKNPQEEAKQKEAKTAMKILKGTIAGLPTAATLVEACSKLLPLISKFLGLT